jgi:arsenate reductase-like glutaredoxin family protein
MKSYFFILMVLVFFSCSENKPTNSNIESSIVSNEENDKALKKELSEVEKEEQKALASSTSMSFDKLDHDFGTIKEGSTNKVLFKVTNTGKRPLVISDVSASCGCTTPKKPEYPIAPGKSDVIEVVFLPTPLQAKEQTKKITVQANTDPSMIVLTIHAFVKTNK